KQDDRVRNWSWIVYPESAPENWRDILDETGEKWIESPLHDRDINETPSEIKNQHWHVIVSIKKKKSYEQALDIARQLNSPAPKKVASLQGAVQYIWHRNKPEKAQYNKSEGVAHHGFKSRHYLPEIGGDTESILQDVGSGISETGWSEYADLVEYAVYEKFDDWFPT
ncbi:replication protein, partial [Streptococcus agalactiae]|nr:replication protein [Streptococcus agalactiae]